VKKAANFRAVVWFLAGMQLHWFLNQNCNWGLDWTNHKLRTNVNSDTFLLPFPFKWNNVFCPKRHHFMHYSRKKSPKRYHFERHCSLSSSPGRVENRGRRKFVPLFSPTFLLSLSLLNIKKTPTIATCINSDPWPTTGMWNVNPWL